MEDAEGKSFVAGILAHIREITAFLNPLQQSYRRFGKYKAPKYVSWSSQNRSQLIRVPAATGDAVRIELRSPDPSCNQYLALALIIAAGLDGVERRMELMPPENRNLFETPELELSHLEQLPSTLGVALSIAQRSELVKSVIPAQTLSTFVKVKSTKSDPKFGII